MSLSLYNYMIWNGNGAYSHFETSEYLYIAGSLKSLMLRDNYIAQQYSSDFPVANVIRISKTTGLLDEAFNTAMLQIPEINGNNAVKEIIISASNKLYCATWFNSVITKINLTTVSKDPSYNVVFNDGRFDSMTLDSNENLYVLGTFTSCNNLPCPKLVKLSSNGVIDTTFSLNSQTFIKSDHPSDAGKIKINESNSSLYVSGKLTSYNNITVVGIIKLDLSTGALDESFSPNFNFPSVARVNTFIIDNENNKIYIGGNGFAEIGAIARISLSTGLFDTSYSSTVGLSSTNMCYDLEKTHFYVSNGALIWKINKSTGIKDISFGQPQFSNLWDMFVDSFGNLVVLGDDWDYGTPLEEVAYWAVLNPNTAELIKITNIPSPGIVLSSTSVVIASGGKAVAAISGSPIDLAVTLNGQPLPTGSIIKNSVTGQKFLKVDGEATAFVAIEIVPPAEWGWDQEGLDAWAILQSL